uniref:Uncharacterized protein n=1 Tax=Globodera rostochiensis TaxID=31243 RepID=A0A914GSG1_GLORO
MYESINYFAVQSPLQIPQPPAIRIPTRRRIIGSVAYDPVFEPDPVAGPSIAMPVHVQEQPTVAEQPEVQVLKMIT